LLLLLGAIVTGETAAVTPAIAAAAIAAADGIWYVCKAVRRRPCYRLLLVLLPFSAGAGVCVDATASAAVLLSLTAAVQLARSCSSSGTSSSSLAINCFASAGAVRAAAPTAAVAVPSVVARAAFALEHCKEAVPIRQLLLVLLLAADGWSARQGSHSCCLLRPLTTSLC
jgi:hypothetical protein